MAGNGQNTGIAAGLGIAASIVTVLAFFNIDSIGDLMSAGQADACDRAWDAVNSGPGTPEAISGLREASDAADDGNLRNRLREAANAHSVMADAGTLIETGRLAESVRAADARWQSACD